MDNSTATATVTFTPSASAPYPNNSTIQVIVNGVTDYAGNAVNGLSFSFDITAGTDLAAPTLTSVTPPNGATGVGRYPLITLTFSEPLDPTTVSAGSVGLIANGQPVSTQMAFSMDMTSLTFGPVTLPFNTVVSVVATHDIADLSGNHLADFSSQFTTAGSAQLTAPRSQPAPGRRRHFRSVEYPHYASLQ